MSTGQTRQSIVLNTAQVRAISSYERLRVYQAAQALRTASVGDVARLLGAKAKSLYYHIHALVEVGLLVSAGMRRAGRREEALFSPAAKELRIAPSHSDPEYLEAIADLAAATLRRAERLHRRSVSDGGIVLSGRRRQRGVLTEDLWLSKDALERLNQRVESLFEDAVRSSEHADDADLYTLTMVFSPAYKTAG